MMRPGGLKWLALVGAAVGMIALAQLSSAANDAALPNTTANNVITPAAPKIDAAVVVGATPATAVGRNATASTKPALTSAAGHGAPKALEHPVWNELNHAQQEALLPLAADWDAIDALRKQKWLKIVNHYASMTPEEQQRVREHMHDWVKLTPEQRRMVRENYERSKKIDPGTKSAQWEQYQQLPEEQKKKLAADAIVKKQMSSLHPPSKVKPLPPIKSGVLLAPVMPTPTLVLKPAASAVVPSTAASASNPAAPILQPNTTSSPTPSSTPAPSNVK